MADISYSSGRSSNRGRRAPLKIDMTPMVDLAFLLLTFFVLTTTLNEKMIVTLDMPEESTTEQKPVSHTRVLTIILTKDNAVCWYQGMPDKALSRTDFSENGIRKVLSQYSKQIKDIVVLVKSTDKAKYQNMIDIIDELTIAQIKEYTIAEIIPQEEDLMKKMFLN